MYSAILLIKDILYLKKPSVGKAYLLHRLKTRIWAVSVRLSLTTGGLKFPHTERSTPVVQNNLPRKGSHRSNRFPESVHHSNTQMNCKPLCNARDVE